MVCWNWLTQISFLTAIDFACLIVSFNKDSSIFLIFAVAWLDYQISSLIAIQRFLMAVLVNTCLGDAEHCASEGLRYKCVHGSILLDSL